MKLKILSMIIMLVFVLAACTDTEGSAVTVTEGYITLEVDETYALDVTVTGAEGESLSYQSKDPNVASVSEAGLVTAVGEGETLITVRSGSSSDFVVVRVNGDRVVAFDEMDFLAAWDRGEYRIELKKDLVLSETLEVDRPFEIIFNGYTLEADFKVVADFEGGLAFNNALPEGMELPVDHAKALKGTIDLNDFPVLVFYKDIDFLDENNNFTVSNMYSFENGSYSSLFTYSDLGDAMPLSSIEDVMMIQTNEPYVFAKGTPFETAVKDASDVTEYMMVNDIQGDIDADFEYTFVFSETQVDVFNEDGLENTFENSNQAKFRTLYNNISVSNNWTAVDDLTTLRDDIDTYITDNALNVTNVYTATQYTFEQVEASNNSIFDLTLKGEGRDIRYFEFEENDAMFDAAFGNIELDSVGFDSLIGSGSGGDQGLVFSIVNAHSFVLKSVDLYRNYYRAAGDSGGTNYGILVGDLVSASHFESIILNVVNNRIYSDDAGDLGFVFGDLEKANGTISYLWMDNNVIYQEDDDGRNDIGLFTGFMGDVSLVVNQFTTYQNTLEFVDSNDTGMFAGTIARSSIRFNGVNSERDVIIGEDNIGIIAGDLYDSMIDVNNIDVENIDLSGSNNIGLLFGETDDSYVNINDVYTEFVNIRGTYYLGGLIGEANSGSRVNVNKVSYFDGFTLEGTYSIGHIIGYTRSSFIQITDVFVFETDLVGTYSLGGIIGDVNDSRIEMNEIDLDDVSISGSGRIGGVIGEVDEDSYINIFDVGIDDVQLLYLENQEGNTYHVGGVVGYASGSKINIFDVSMNFSSITTPTSVDYGYGGLVGELNNTSLEVNHTTIESNVLGNNSLGGAIGIARDSVIDMFESDFYFEADFINLDPSEALNRVGGLVGFVENTTFHLRKLIVEATVLDGDDYIGGLFGQMRRSGVDAERLSVTISAEGSDFIGGVTGFADGSTIDMSESNVSLDVINSIGIVGGLAGEAVFSNLIGFNVNFNTTATNISYRFGGLVGSSNSSYYDMRGFTADVDVTFDSELDSFEGDTFGIFIGEAINDVIKLYYRENSIIQFDNATVAVDVFDTVIFGIGSYTPNDAELILVDM